MDNPEKLETLGTQRQRKTKQKHNIMIHIFHLPLN